MRLGNAPRIVPSPRFRSLYRPPVACHSCAVRFLLPALLALTCAPLLAAEKKEKPVGRTLQQRFASPVEQQDLVFDTRQGAVGNGRSFDAGTARTKGFHFNQRFAPAKYETAEFSQTKKSWWGNFKFGTKAANTRTKSEVPNANKEAATKTAETREAHDSTKTAAVRDLPGRDRPYLGPERKNLDRSIDPTKPLPGWAGDRLEVLSLEQIRELLNKNK